MKKKRAKKATSKEAPPFDEAYGELRAIVERLEDGTLGLEESLAEFEAGIGLLRTCTRILDEADRRIEILVGFDANGEPRTREFDATATHDEVEAPEESPDERDDSGGLFDGVDS